SRRRITVRAIPAGAVIRSVEQAKGAAAMSCHRRGPSCDRRKWQWHLAGRKLISTIRRRSRWRWNAAAIKQATAEYHQRHQIGQRADHPHQGAGQSLIGQCRYAAEPRYAFVRRIEHAIRERQNAGEDGSL